MCRRAVLAIACVLLAGCGATSPLRDNDPDGGVTRDVVQGDCPIGFDETIPATLRVTADDQYRLYLTGRLIDDAPRLWSSPQRYQAQVFRHPARRNAIAIEATNTMNVDGLDRGVVADLQVTVAGRAISVLTDASWRMSPQFVNGWSDVDFTAPGWAQAIDEGAHGIAPWGPVLGTSVARWLWSYDSNRPAGSKPVRETIWLRRAFYFAINGTVRDTPGPCP